VSLARRNFRLLLAFDVVLYSPLYWPYMFHLVCTLRGLSALQFGTLKAVYYASVIVLELPGGVLADRFGRRSALVACALFNALGCLMYAVATTFWAFASAELVLALSTALLSGADSALLYDSLLAEGEQARYAQAESRIKTACFAVSGLGMGASDLWLVPAGGPSLAYIATGALSLVGVVAAAALREPARASTVGMREVAAGAMRDAVANRRVLAVLAYGSGLYLLARAANSLLFDPLLAAHGIPVERYGTVAVGIGMVAALAAYRSAQLLAHNERVLTLAMPILGLAMYAGLAWVQGPWIAAVLLAQGPLHSMLAVTTPVLLNREVTSSDHRATVLSLQSVAWRGTYALASPAIGWSLDVLSLRQAVIATAVLGFVPLLASFLLGRRA